MIPLQKIDKAVTVASDVINLVVAIYSANVDQIAAAAKTLVEASF